MAGLREKDFSPIFLDTNIAALRSAIEALGDPCLWFSYATISREWC